MKIIKDWRTKDWYWIVGILIGFILIILSWRLNDKDNVVNIISMFASGASIVLAIVAIIQSTIYNVQTNELNAKISEKLINMDNNIQIVRDSIINKANNMIDKLPIEKDEKEEFKYRLGYEIYNNSFEASETSFVYKMKRLINILEISKGKVVRYRIEGVVKFTNDILQDYEINYNNITIILQNDSVVTNNINDISFSEYDERTDVWIYGDRTNRFNISK